MVLLAREGELAGNKAGRERISQKVARESIQRDTRHQDHPPYRLHNLHFSTQIAEAVREADLIFIAVETPAQEGYAAFGAAPNLGRFEAAVRMVGEVAEHDFILVQKSTVACGTVQRMSDLLYSTVRPGVQFEVLCNPEFLAEGTAIHNLLYPDRVLIGSAQTDRGLLAAGKLTDIYAAWVPREKILLMDSRSCELSKLAANAMLAQRISSINALSTICETLGADITEVSRACGLDHRLGRHMLKASVGFGGSCFRKDLLHLANLASSQGFDEVAEYWHSIHGINEFQKRRFVDRISSQLPNASRNMIIAILGFAFKAGTNDARDSAAVTVVEKLLLRGYHVRIYDPEVAEVHIWSELRKSSLQFKDTHERVAVSSTAYEACDGAHAVAILTEWEEFRYNPMPQGTSGTAVVNDDMVDEDFDVLVHQDLYSTLSRSSGAALNKPQKLTANEQSCSTPARQLDGVLDGSRSALVTNRTGILVNGFAESVTQDYASFSVSAPTDIIEKPKSARASVHWDQIARIMQNPKFIFDGRNIVSRHVEALGFKLEAVGKSSRAGDRSDRVGLNGLYN